MLSMTKIDINKKKLEHKYCCVILKYNQLSVRFPEWWSSTKEKSAEKSYQKQQVNVYVKQYYWKSRRKGIR